MGEVFSPNDDYTDQFKEINENVNEIIGGILDILELKPDSVILIYLYILKF